MPNRIGQNVQPATTARTDSPNLREGASGPAVAKLQSALVKTGFLTGAADGSFGPKTTAALKAFQAANGLSADGAVGPKTWEKLASAPAGAPAATTTSGGWGAKPSTPAGTAPAGGWGPKPATTTGTGGTAAKGKVVSLTFDDGPSPKTTPKVLETLKKFGVKATFFVTGEGALKNPALIKQIIAEGHTIGNHTYDHADLSKLSKSQIESELSRTQAAVDQALGKHYEMTMVRPPYGAGAAKTREAAPGKDVVLWNVDSNDWRFKNDDAKIIQNIFEGSESVRARGGTILMHDIHPQTVRVLDGVIDRLQREGYDIQRTDEILASKRSGVP